MNLTGNNVFLLFSNSSKATTCLRTHNTNQTQSPTWIHSQYIILLTGSPRTFQKNRWRPEKNQQLSKKYKPLATWQFCDNPGREGALLASWPSTPHTTPTCHIRMFYVRTLIGMELKWMLELIVITLESSERQKRMSTWKFNWYESNIYSIWMWFKSNLNCVWQNVIGFQYRHRSVFTALFSHSSVKDIMVSRGAETAPETAT